MVLAPAALAPTPLSRQLTRKINHSSAITQRQQELEQQ
jgi:hypothetical protein